MMLADVANGAFIRIVSVVFLISSHLQTVLCQCSGTTTVLTATETFNVFTSINYPFSYQNNLNCVWRIETANVTHAIRLEIIDAAIEYHADCVYDTGEVFDGYNATWSSLGRFCGTSNPSFVSTDNYMTVTFMSDYSLVSKGFKAEYRAGIRSSLLDPTDEDNSLDTVVILGASIGAVVFLVLVMAVVFTYIQAKKAKEIRRNPHLRRGNSSSRVEPFDCDYNAGIWLPPAPPAYGEIYSSPMSPPPDYCEVDPNPHPNAPLQGRSEFMSRPSAQHIVQSSSENPVFDRSTRTNENRDTNANTHFVRHSNVASINTSGSAGTSLTNLNNIQRGPAVSPRRAAQRNSGSQRTNQNTPIASNAGATAALQILNPSALNRSNASSRRSVSRSEIGNTTLDIPSAAGGVSPSAVSSTGNNLSARMNTSQSSTRVTSLGNLNSLEQPAPTINIEADDNDSDRSSTISEISLPDDLSVASSRTASFISDR